MIQRDAREKLLTRLQLKIGGLSCSFCAESIRKAFSRLDGVHEVHVSLAHEEALVQYDSDRVTEATIKDTLRALGYTIRDPEKVRTFEEEERELSRERDRLLIAAGFTWIGFLIMVLMWIGKPLPMPAMRALMPSLALLTVFGPGLYILRMAAASIRRLIFNQHVLLELGAFAGLAGGILGLINPTFPAPDFFAVAVFITTYHILSGYVSLLVRTRASQAVRKLLELQPPTARVIRDGREAEVPIEDVQRGDMVRVRPGERVPVDGEVIDGASAVDESLVTGESIPQEKVAGDEVIGGSVNQSGTLVVRVTKIGEESFLQQVARHIQEARAMKPGIVAIADRVLKVYVPGVLVAAGLAILIWTLGAWLLTGTANWVRASFAALAALVMGYPCALGMATPLAMIRGGGMAAQKGILMRSGEAFQVFKDVRKIILDKTGTITKGAPRVVEVVPLAGRSVQDVLSLAAGAEHASEHPLARAIVSRAEELGAHISPASEFEAIAGRGVRATIDGVQALVGSPAFLGQQEVDLRGARDRLAQLQEQGNTVIGVAVDGEPVGLIAIADTVKEDAREAVERMREAALEPVMITGDNERTARAVGKQVGIAEVYAQVLPQEKAAKIRDLQRQGHRVAMVGDGINDAPALMQADVGVAIGAGTDIAIESSDVILIGDRLSPVVDAYYIGRTSYRKTVQNLTLAFSFNGIGVPLAVTGLLHPIWAMVAMAASVSTVLLNSFGGRMFPAARSKAAGFTQAAVARPEARMEKLIFNVPTIHCEGCAGNIQRVLAPIAGVQSVEGNPQTKEVIVIRKEGAVSDEDLTGRITDSGHVVAGVRHDHEEVRR
ncbi:MAG: heavy metal translocating P-type ATPase [bacterium]